MVLTKTTGVLLLQAAVFFSGVAARCRPVCAPGDDVIGLLRSNNDGISFCSAFLNLPATTVGATVTPTVVATVTETSHVTEVVTEIDSVTITVSAPVLQRAKRSIDYPGWLPAAYPPSRVSSACACLSITLSVATTTGTAEAVTVTVPVTVTEIATSTDHLTAVTTETATPLISKRSVKIEVLRKDSLASMGWLYYSNGPAVANTILQAATFNFTLAPGTTTSDGVRISLEGTSPPALGFLKSNNPSNIVELEDYYGTLTTMESTPPYSGPVVSGSDRRESDIWIVNTNTRMIGWQWIATNGASPVISLWRVGGRLYPVGNVDAFNRAIIGVTASKYEVVFRYTVVTEL